MVSIERAAADGPVRSAGSAAEVVARTEALIRAHRARAAAVDGLRQMVPESVVDLKAAGTARLYQPARFGGCEADMRSGVDEASAIATRDDLPNDEQRAKFRSHAAFAGRLAACAVELLWDAGASSSVYSDNPMSGVYRDMSVAARHFTQNWGVNGSTHGRVQTGFALGDPTL